MTTNKWDIAPGEHEGTRKSLIISMIMGAIVMVFVFTVFPMLKVTGTRPSLPDSFNEVLVDIVKAKEREQPQQEEQKEEEEEPEPEEAPQRRELEERRTTPRERQREVRTRPETQDLALQQEVDLNLQRQRSQRSDRRDRDMGQRSSRDRASTSDIIVPRGDASLEASAAPRASIGRDRSGSGRSSRRADRGARSASLELGDGPAVDVQYEPQTDTDPAQDASAVIEWMRANKASVPKDLLEPEYFNYQAGDLTSRATFVGPDGKEYTVYLLGRDGNPPELKIFLVQGTSGVLVTDIGAQGARSESLQAGRVLVRGDRMSLQMSQISPGDPRADQAMDVFRAWWSAQ